MMNNQKEDNKQIVRILGIESSCDETAAAVVENGTNVLSSVVASQIELHAEFGGVFPEMASRQHVESINQVVRDALSMAHMTLDDIDAIAVTKGPGLAGSLVVGINYAKGLSISRDLPLLGINHLEGHIYSSWIATEDDNYSVPEFPLLALLVSGGHTELILMTDHHEYRRLGGTLDDAAGEAFDKVARLLGLSYPGGPSIQKASEIGNKQAFDFPRAWLPDTWDFSFSGLKTAVLREVKKMESFEQAIPVEDMAASFQESVVDVLATKTINAAREYKPSMILLAGGVSANKALRERFINQEEFRIVIPPLQYCTDNAVMIATAGYFRFIHKHFDNLQMDALPNWPIS